MVGSFASAKNKQLIPVSDDFWQLQLFCRNIQLKTFHASTQWNVGYVETFEYGMRLWTGLIASEAHIGMNVFYWYRMKIDMMIDEKVRLYRYPSAYETTVIVMKWMLDENQPQSSFSLQNDTQKKKKKKKTLVVIRWVEIYTHSKRSQNTFKCKNQDKQKW